MSSETESPTPQTETETQPGCCEGTLREWSAVAEKCTREEPLKCATIAFLAGFLFTILPIGQIIGALVRLVFSLIRPALVLLGAMKVFEEIEKRRES